MQLAIGCSLSATRYRFPARYQLLATSFSPPEWCVCSSACAGAAANVHLAASVWRKLLTKEQPVRTWVAVHNLPAFVSMPERQLRALLFDKPKSRKRISAFVYDRDTAKWQLRQAQAKDIYIENQRQRAERKRLPLSRYHQATRNLKRKQTTRRLGSSKVTGLL